MIAQLRVAAMLALAAPLLLGTLPAQATPPVTPAPTAPATPPTGTKAAPGDTAAQPTATIAPPRDTAAKSAFAKAIDDVGLGAILKSLGISPEEFILTMQAIRQEQAAKKAADEAIVTNIPNRANTRMSTGVKTMGAEPKKPE